MFCSLLCKKRNPQVKRKKCILKYGVESVAGWKPTKSDWINQDNYLFFEDNSIDKNTGQNNKRQFYVVLDGHGPDGHKVSDFCGKHLRLLLPKTDSMVTLFNRMQKSLCESSIDVENSGTTCSILIINDKTVEVYNIGDSKAVLARRMITDGKLSATTLTEDHTPEVPLESERVKSCGGEIYSNSMNVSGHSPKTGPLRVWFPCEKTSGLIGLAMTRSWGDAAAHRVGVISEPHKEIISLQDHDEFIIFASDGIWDAIPNAVEFVDYYISSLPPIQNKSDWDPQEAARRLVVHARKLWEKNAYIDDITCFVIRIK